MISYLFTSFLRDYGYFAEIFCEYQLYFIAEIFSSKYLYIVDLLIFQNSAAFETEKFFGPFNLWRAVWVCDFTYLRAAGRFYYLCVILDLFSRKVIAYKLSSKPDTRLAIETLDMAVANRKSSKGVIFHSDRGCQFTSEAFRKLLDELNIVQSFSAKGHPYDNAVMECFSSIWKRKKLTEGHILPLMNLTSAFFNMSTDSIILSDLILTIIVFLPIRLK